MKVPEGGRENECHCPLFEEHWNDEYPPFMTIHIHRLMNNEMHILQNFGCKMYPKELEILRKETKILSKGHKKGIKETNISFFYEYFNIRLRFL